VEFLSNLGGIDWQTVGFILAGLIGVALIVNKKKKGKGSASGGGITDGRDWCYMDDVTTEPNGPQDWACVLGLMTTHKKPIFMGATLHQDDGKVDMPFAKKINDASGMGIPLRAGANRKGINQGASPLAKEIAKWAHKAPNGLNVCMGGLFTDAALAVKLDPSIAKKITVFNFYAHNAEKDMESYNYLRNMGVDMRIFGGKDYLLLSYVNRTPENLNTIAKRRAWLQNVMGRSRSGKIAIERFPLEKAALINLGQTGNASPLRLGDSMMVIAAFYGMEKAKDQNFAYAKYEEGLKNLPA
jgi:hypothetical protein